MTLQSPLSKLAALALVTAIVWEWRHARPILELRLLANRNLSMFGLPADQHA